MNKLIHIITFTFIAFTTLQAQEISQKQWSIVHERTADWCPYCGTWGWDYKTQLLNKFKDKELIFMAVHHSGGLKNADSDAFTNNFDGIGQPIFYLDGANLQVNSNNIASRLTDVEGVLDLNSSLTAFAGVGIDAKLDPTTKNLEVNAVVEFLSDIEGGDYYLALYLVENITAYQEGQGSTAKHVNVLRKSLFTNTFGNSIVKGAVTKGSRYNFSASASGITADASNLNIVGVIWAKNALSGKYLFFNGNQKEVKLTSATENTHLTTNQLTVFQNESNHIVADIQVNEAINQGNIQVVDVAGKIVANKAISNMKDGKNRISIEGNFRPGMYLVNLQNGSSQVTQKVIIQ